MNQARESARVKVDAFVKLGGADREYVFRTRDLSNDGVFLYTKVAHAYPFKSGSTLTMELYDYDQCITCRVVVARIVEPGSPESDHYPTGFGLHIIEMTDADRERLVNLVERLGNSPAELY